MLPTNTLQGAFLFVALILPGYLFIQGYRPAAEIPKERRDIYVVAQTMVFSIILLGLVWPLGVGGVLRDIQKGELLDRGTLSVYLLVAVALLGPYAAGYLVGLVARLLSHFGLLPGPSLPVWDEMWQQITAAAGEDVPVVVMETKTAGQLIGVFGQGSLVNTTSSSTPRDIYLAQQFIPSGGQLVATGSGIYIEGADIISVTYGVS